MDCWRISALAAAVLLASVTPTLANLVTDPGFESCPTDPPPPGWSGTAGCNIFSHTGSWAAGFEGTNTLAQSIPTTAGTMYDFSFWVSGVDLATPTQFTASFGSDQVLDLVNVTPTTYMFEDFTVTATAASTTLDFTAASSAGWLLDDVSVTAVPAAVPEPPALGLFAVATLGLAALYRRRA
ncbi:MAG: hypothetical protein WB611_20570 [Stellaceae bacterium]